MNKKVLCVFSLFFMSILLFFTSHVNAESPEATRLWGNDRYETNYKIVKQGWQKSDYVVIVSGENFPDALSAAPLARKYNAPILLSYSLLSSEINDELQQLGVKKAFIIGGTGALSSAIEGQLKSFGIDSERLSGEDRYSTSIAIANKIGTQNGVIVTTGNDYTDALSIAPIAGKLQMPIILSQQDALESIQKKFIDENAITKTYVLGDTNIISDNVASKFPNVQRITGDSKYVRNIVIINAFKNDFDFSTVILASGENFPDALSGSAFAALNGNPIILTGNSSEDYINDFLSIKGTNTIYALGGNSSITDDVLNGIVNRTKALNIVKSKVKISSEMFLGTAGEYKEDGSNFYYIGIYNKNGTANTTDCKYDFLVDKQTWDAYKIVRETFEITPLDNMSIGISN